LTQYRLYLLDGTNAVTRPARIVDADSDEYAIELATQLLNGHALELWSGSRLLVRLNPDTAASAAPQSTTKGDEANGSSH
jgi:hypothetical protein